mgnify:FL=1
MGVELLRQLTARDIVVDHCFFDGAPCVELSAPYKKLMYFKFKTLANMMKKKNSEEILQSRLLKKFSKGDTESLICKGGKGIQGMLCRREGGVPKGKIQYC